MLDKVTFIDPFGIEVPLSEGDVSMLPGMEGRFMPPFTWTEHQVPLQPGATLTGIRAEPRELVFPIFVSKSDAVTMRSYLRDLSRYLDPLRGEGTIRVTDPAGATREIGARYLNGMEFPETQDTSSGYWKKLGLVFRCLDPHWIDTTDIVRDFTQGATEYHLGLPGANGDFASTPDSSALSIISAISVRARIALNDWTPGARSTIVSKWGAAGQRSMRCVVNPDGTLGFHWSNDGNTVFTADSTTTPGLSDSAKKWIRWDFVGDNTLVGHDVIFYTSDDGINWSILGATITLPLVSSMFDSNAPVVVGAEADGTSPMAGDVHVVEIRNAAGRTVARPDFNRQQRESFRDPYDNVWDYYGGATPEAGAQQTFFPIFPMTLNPSEIFGQFTEDNQGDVDAWPIWTISGPGTSLFINNLTTDKEMALTHPIAAGEQITIDTRPGKKLVVDHNGGNLFDKLTDHSFWPIVRGLNEIESGIGDSTAASRIRLTYRRRYLVN